MANAATRAKALLRSALTTAHLIGELTVYLEEKLAPTTTIHGVLMNGVYGLGVHLVWGIPASGNRNARSNSKARLYALLPMMSLK